MGVLAANSAVPLYRQLAQRIRKDYVDNSSIDATGPIPSEKELIEEYQVSRITVRNAVNQLVSEGLLKKTQGKGTFVTQRRAYPMDHGGGFSHSCVLMQISPSTRVISIEKVEPPAEEKAFFGLGKGEKVIRIKRLRLGDGRPMILERLYLPPAFAALAKENLEGSFYALVEKQFNMIINRGPRWIEIYKADKDDARLMGLSQGEPLILTWECAYLENETPLHSTKLLISPEFRFHFR